MNEPLVLELVSQHKNLSEWLETAKEKERKLRDKIIALTFANPKNGTNKVSFEKVGLEVKAVMGENYTLDKAGLKEILEEIPNGDKLVDWKPSLVNKEYKNLSDEDKQKLSACLTVKPKTPTLSYEGDTFKPFNITALNGVLYMNGNELNHNQAWQWARFFEFSCPEDLIKELEGI